MTNEERAREAVEKILIDLSDRRGMSLLDQIRWDDPELWKEIIGDGSSIILAALNAATAPLVAERERLRDVLKNIQDYGELANVSADSGFRYHGGKKSPSKDVWQFPRHLLVDLEAALAEKEPD